MFEANPETGLVRMYGEIGDYFEDGVSERDLMQALDSMEGRDIDVHLKSDGGDVFQGLSIFNQLSHYSGKVTITVDAIAASIASVIAMAGDEIAIHENSMVMIHNPWTVAIGDAKEFRGVADLLDKIGNEIADIYSKRSGTAREIFIEMMVDDTYFTADEALEIGMVDRIITREDRAGSKNSMPSSALKNIVAAATFPRRAAAKHRLRRDRLKINKTGIAKA